VFNFFFLEELSMGKKFQHHRNQTVPVVNQPIFMTQTIPFFCMEENHQAWKLLYQNKPRITIQKDMVYLSYKDGTAMLRAIVKTGAKFKIDYKRGIPSFTVLRY